MESSAIDKGCEDIVAQFFPREQRQHILDTAYLVCKKVADYDVHVPEKQYFDSFCCQSNDDILDMCTRMIPKIVGENLLSCSAPNYRIHSYLLLSICLPIGIIANALILYTLLKTHNILPRQTCYFLSSLAIGDVGVILNFVLLLIYEDHSENISDSVNRYLMPSIHKFFAGISLIQISFVSIERAVAVTWPLYYPQYITRKRAKYATIFGWAFSLCTLVAALLRIPYDRYMCKSCMFYFDFIVFLIIPMLTVFTSYTCVAVSAFQNIQQDKQRARVVSTLLKNSNLQVKRHSAWSLHSIRQKEVRISLNLTVMVLPFLACWGLFTFTHFYEQFTGHNFPRLYDWFVNILPVVISSTNPIAFLILTRSLRKSVLKVIRKTFLKSLFPQRKQTRATKTTQQTMNVNNNIQTGNNDIASL